LAEQSEQVNQQNHGKHLTERDISSRRAIQVIAAGQEDEHVSDSSISPGYSAFTDALLDILEGELDFDDDGILTASEIGSNLEKLVASHSINQRPMYSPIAGARGGDFIFKLFHINNL
jgi:hypothetical protein